MNFATYERSLMSRKVTYLQVLGIVPWAKSLHSGLTLCNPMDCSPRGSSVHGILQAGIREWVAIPFSRGSSRPREAESPALQADSLLSAPGIATPTPRPPPARDYELLMTISMMTLVLSLRNERSKVKVMSHIESVKIG